MGPSWEPPWDPAGSWWGPVIGSSHSRAEAVSALGVRQRLCYSLLPPVAGGLNRGGKPFPRALRRPCGLGARGMLTQSHASWVMWLLPCTSGLSWVKRGHSSAHPGLQGEASSTSGREKFQEMVRLQFVFPTLMLQLPVATSPSQPLSQCHEIILNVKGGPGLSLPGLKTP